jgi:hypothetical protein
MFPGRHHRSGRSRLTRAGTAAQDRLPKNSDPLTLSCTGGSGASDLTDDDQVISGSGKKAPRSWKAANNLLRARSA